MERGVELALPEGLEPRAIADGGGRLLVLGGPKGTSPLDKPPRRVTSLLADGTGARLVVEDSFGDTLAASEGFVAWASPHAVAVRAIEGDEPIAPADAKMTCAPAVSAGVCAFVARPSLVPDAAGGSPIATLDARTGDIRVLCIIPSEVGALAASRGAVFVAEPAARAVYVVPMAGGAPETLVRGEEHVGPIAAAGDTLFAVVDRAVLAVPAGGGEPRAVASAHDAFRHAKKLVIGRDALYVVTRAYALASGEAAGAALHRIARVGHSVETVVALPPPPGTDFLSMLRADTLDDVAVVDEDVFVLTRSRGRVQVTRLPPPEREEEAGPPEPSVDPVRDAYEAHLGPRDPLEPTVRRLEARGWTGALVQGRTAARNRYTATSGLRRDAAGYDLVLLHRRREAWTIELAATLVEHELDHGGGDRSLLDLVAQHGGVTMGPFSVGRRKLGVLLVDGPPILPASVEVEGRPVRLLRAVTLTPAEHAYAEAHGAAALIAKLAAVLATSVSDPRRASVV